jgi:hypothetical protein
MIGDIILQKRSGWIGYFVSWFTKSEWVHCGISIGDWYISHVDGWGKHKTLIWEWGDDIIVLTPKTPLLTPAQELLRKCCENERVRGYAFWSAIKSWFWKNTDDEKKNGKRYTCSSYVSAMYRKGTGTDLIPNRSDDTTQPQDFLESPFLKRKEL